MPTKAVKSPTYVAKVSHQGLNTRIDAVRITDDKYIIVFLSFSPCAIHPCTRSFSKAVMKNYGSPFIGFSPISQANFKNLCNKQAI